MPRWRWTRWPPWRCWRGFAIERSFDGALPYLTALIGALQAVTAVVLSAYYKKSTTENCKGGIVYDAAFAGEKEPETESEGEIV